MIVSVSAATWMIGGETAWVHDDNEDHHKELYYGVPPRHTCSTEVAAMAPFAFKASTALEDTSYATTVFPPWVRVCMWMAKRVEVMVYDRECVWHAKACDNAHLDQQVRCHPCSHLSKPDKTNHSGLLRWQWMRRLFENGMSPQRSKGVRSALSRSHIQWLVHTSCLVIQ